MFFFSFDFVAYFHGFYRFLLDFGRARAVQKFKKFAQDAKKVDFGTCLGRIFLRRWVWEGFWHDFGWILTGFLVDFEGCGPHC